MGKFQVSARKWAFEVSMKWNKSNLETLASSMQVEIYCSIIQISSIVKINGKEIKTNFFCTGFRFCYLLKSGIRLPLVNERVTRLSAVRKMLQQQNSRFQLVKDATHYVIHRESKDESS